MANKFAAIILIFILFVSCSKKQMLIQDAERLADYQHEFLPKKSPHLRT